MRKFDEVFRKLDAENRKRHSLINFLITKVSALEIINLKEKNADLGEIIKEINERIEKEIKNED